MDKISDKLSPWMRHSYPHLYPPLKHILKRGALCFTWGRNHSLCWNTEDLCMHKALFLLHANANAGKVCCEVDTSLPYFFSKWCTLIDIHLKSLSKASFPLLLILFALNWISLYWNFLPRVIWSHHEPNIHLSVLGKRFFLQNIFCFWL